MVFLSLVTVWPSGSGIVCVDKTTLHRTRVSTVTFISMRSWYVTVTGSNRTLRTQDTSVPRHFGTGAEVSRRHFGTAAEVSGQFGPKTLRHQDISALVSGQFGTSAWTLRHYGRTPLRQCAGLHWETTFKDTQGHRYYIGFRVNQGHRQRHHSTERVQFPIFDFNRNYPSIFNYLKL